MRTEPFTNVTQDVPLPPSGRHFRLFRGAGLSLAVQWSLLVVLLVALAVGVFGWIAVEQQKRTYTEQTDAFGHDMAAQLAATAGEPLLADDSLSLEVTLHQLAGQRRVLGAAVIGKGKEPLTEGIQPPGPLDIPPNAEAVLDWQWSAYDQGDKQARSYWAPIRFGGLNAGTALITLDAGTLDKGLRSALWDITLAALLVIPVAMGFGVFLTRRLSRPLRALASIGGSLESDQTLDLPPPGGQTEIDRVVEVFTHLSRGVQEKERLEHLFRRYVPATAAGSLLQGDGQAVLQGTTIEGSVLFGDVTGFTALSEPLPPEEVVELLNEYFGYITVAADSCGGVVDSFSGDGVMIVFGGEKPDPLHALHAATCALLIRETVGRINRRRAGRGEFPVWFRIGVNSGAMAQCNLGGSERMQHTVIGDTVNVAARLCGLGDPGEVVIGERTAEAAEVGERFRLTRMPRQPIQGRNREVVPYLLDALLNDDQTHLLKLLDGVLPTEWA